MHPIIFVKKPLDLSQIKSSKFSIEIETSVPSPWRIIDTRTVEQMNGEEHRADR